MVLVRVRCKRKGMGLYFKDIAQNIVLERYYSYAGLVPIKASMPQHIQCPFETLEERAPRRIGFRHDSCSIAVRKHHVAQLAGIAGQSISPVLVWLWLVQFSKEISQYQFGHTIQQFLLVLKVPVQRRGNYLSWYESGIGCIPTGIVVSMMVSGQKFAGEDA